MGQDRKLVPYSILARRLETRRDEAKTLRRPRVLLSSDDWSTALPRGSCRRQPRPSAGGCKGAQEVQWPHRCGSAGKGGQTDTHPRPLSLSRLDLSFERALEPLARQIRAAEPARAWVSLTILFSSPVCPSQRLPFRLCHFSAFPLARCPSHISMPSSACLDRPRFTCHPAPPRWHL